MPVWRPTLRSPSQSQSIITVCLVPNYTVKETNFCEQFAESQTVECVTSCSPVRCPINYTTLGDLGHITFDVLNWFERDSFQHHTANGKLDKLPKSIQYTTK